MNPVTENRIYYESPYSVSNASRSQIHYDTPTCISTPGNSNHPTFHPHPSNTTFPSTPSFARKPNYPTTSPPLHRANLPSTPSSIGEVGMYEEKSTLQGYQLSNTRPLPLPPLPPPSSSSLYSIESGSTSQSFSDIPSHPSYSDGRDYQSLPNHSTALSSHHISIPSPVNHVRNRPMPAVTSQIYSQSNECRSVYLPPPSSENYEERRCNSCFQRNTFSHCLPPPPLSPTRQFSSFQSSQSSRPSSPPTHHAHSITNKPTSIAVVRSEVNEITTLRKAGKMKEARIALQKLCQEFSSFHVVWIEFSRLELDLGNVILAREAIFEGLRHLPGNEVLLERRLKIEERLHNAAGVLDCALQFLETNNSRYVKSIVEAAVILSKLGYGYQASSLFQQLLHHPMYVQGGVTLDYIRFVFKMENYQYGMVKLREVLKILTKHNPMWFYAFSIFEQDFTIFWKEGDIASRIINHQLCLLFDKARECLPGDLKWKVSYIAAQTQLRTFTHIRLCTRMHKAHLREYCNLYPGVIRQCYDDLHQCINQCTEEYKWKVWLLASRVLALAGQRDSALKVGITNTKRLVIL